MYMFFRGVYKGHIEVAQQVCLQMDVALHLVFAGHKITRSKNKKV